MKKKRTKKQEQAKQKRRARKEAEIKRNGGMSNYYRKRQYLNAHGVFGFEVPEPKP